MIAEHTIDWAAQWRREWRDDGRKEGRQQGEAAVLLRQLRRRHGALGREIEERVVGADADQLLDWADRFVTASTLDEVFDGKGGN